MSHLSLAARIRATLAARDDRLQLERELAAYDTPAGRQELVAILARHTPEQRRQVDAALDRLRVHP
ncbi:MAG: hypothetical protein M3O55_00165 [Actinomycetota bacterium]|nr:hypothetical protein [Actinomycetota bacterium]